MLSKVLPIVQRRWVLESQRDKSTIRLCLLVADVLTVAERSWTNGSTGQRPSALNDLLSISTAAKRVVPYVPKDGVRSMSMVMLKSDLQSYRYML